MSQRKNEAANAPIIHRGVAYNLISDYYQHQVAERSGLPLMNHINEGIEYLRAWGVTDTVIIDAWCLHPLVQNYQDVPNSDAKKLAQEYAHYANKYLCVPENDWIEEPAQLYNHLSDDRGDMSKECAWLLLADKVQNQKDFRIHHLFKHERYSELENYFNLWIKTLLVFYIQL